MPVLVDAFKNAFGFAVISTLEFGKSNFLHLVAVHDQWFINCLQ
jgi:hypothetical protein